LPKAWLDKTRGLLFGYGLKENVRQLYRELSNLYVGPEDHVFLFGFSRGAFTVRALAGLLYRCHLPMQASADLDQHFERAWDLYTPMRENESAIRQFRKHQRPVSIHFLGLWDTVKSYGGLNPVILPHLRHNPIVKHVRHALALNERRAWFKPTSWGVLDSDEHGAFKRLKAEDLLLCRQQDIEEVWFTGCHSDIGGNDKGFACGGKIVLRWMLGEAVNVKPGLRLSDEGMALLGEPDPLQPPQINESWNLVWRLVEKIPRREIDNSGNYPIRTAARGSDGSRTPEKLRRGETVHLHASIQNAHSISGKIAIRRTKPFPRMVQDHARESEGHTSVTRSSLGEDSVSGPGPDCAN
jgi:hypothetical protein